MRPVAGGALRTAVNKMQDVFLGVLSLPERSIVSVEQLFAAWMRHEFGSEVPSALPAQVYRDRFAEELEEVLGHATPSGAVLLVCPDVMTLVVAARREECATLGLSQHQDVLPVLMGLLRRTGFEYSRGGGQHG